MIALLLLARTGERALMKLTISLANAWQATLETNAKRVCAIISVGSEMMLCL